MASRQILIADLSRGRQTRKMHVRISHKWNCCNPKRDMELISMDFVAADENEDHIHCTIKSRFVPDFNGLIREGCYYTIQNFAVEIARPTYRPVRRDLLISLDASAQIDEIITKLPKIDRYAYDLIPFGNLQEVGANRKHLCDVIGHVVGMSEVGQRVYNKRLTKLQYIDIVNLSMEKCRLIIWGEEMIQSIPEFDDKCRVLIITGTIVNATVDGMFSLSSSSSTKFFGGMEIGAIAEFRTRFTDGQFNEPLEKLRMNNTLITPEEFEKNKKTISYLVNALDEGADLVSSTIFVCAKFANIDERSGWRYNSCPYCPHKVPLEDGKYYCNYCKKDILFPTPRYRLEVTLEEDGAEVKCVLFDREVEKLVGIKASDVVRQLADVGHESPVPGLIKKLMGKEYKVHLKPNVKSYTTVVDDFTVARVFVETDFVPKDTEADQNFKGKLVNAATVEGFETRTPACFEKRSFLNISKKNDVEAIDDGVDVHESGSSPASVEGKKARKSLKFN